MWSPCRAGDLVSLLLSDLGDPDLWEIFLWGCPHPASPQLFAQGPSIPFAWDWCPALYSSTVPVALCLLLHT